MDSPDLTPPPAPARPIGPQTATRRAPPRWMHLLAVVLGVGPLYAMVFASGLAALSKGDFSIDARGLIMNVGVMLSFAVFLIVLLMLLGERPWDLQLRGGTLPNDVGMGIGLFFWVLGGLMLLKLGSNYLEQLHLIPKQEEVPGSNVDLIGSVAKNPLLLAFFLGPIIWLQAAFVEELTRVFVLTRLWKVWPAQGARLASVFAWSVLFGLAHVYEGLTGVLGTAVIGLVLGLHYYRHGRVLPLMIAHGLYDTLATLALLYVVRHPELLSGTSAAL